MGTASRNAAVVPIVGAKGYDSCIRTPQPISSAVSSASAAAERAENVQIRPVSNYSRGNRIEPILAKAEMFERRTRCRSSKEVIARQTFFPKPCLCSRRDKVSTDALRPMSVRSLDQAARISSIGSPWRSTPKIEVQSSASRSRNKAREP